MAKQNTFSMTRIKSIKSIKKGDILVFKNRDEQTAFLRKEYLKGLKQKSYQMDGENVIMMIKGFKSEEEFTFINKVCDEDKHLIEGLIIEFEL